jgi:LCP family protein required for cell wall assembly
MPNIVIAEIKIPKLLLDLVLIIALVTVLIFSLNFFFLGKALTLKEKMNILIIGMDDGTNRVSVKTAPQTDTLILTLIDPKKGKASLISIPGNTMVNIPSHGLDQVKEASALGGFALTKVLVSELTSTSIDHYMVVNFEGFKHLVDLIGGVEVNVDKAMRFVDEYGLSTFSINPGKQILNGDKALKYIRFHDASLGEISSVARQKEVLYAAFKKLKQKVNIFMLPELIKAKGKYIKTDLTTRDLLKLLKFSRGIDRGKNIADYVLPGSLNKEDWVAEPAQIKLLMDKI